VTRLIEVEIAGPTCGNLLFKPCERVVRGRYEVGLATATDPAAGMVTQKYGGTIPGQVLGLDLDTGRGYVREPLWTEEWRELRARLDHHRFKLEPPEAEFKDVHVPTWVYWLARAVEGGIAKLLKGSLPKSHQVDGKPRKVFYVRPASQSVNGEVGQDVKDALARRDQQIQAQQEQIDRLIALVSEQKAAPAKPKP